MLSPEQAKDLWCPMVRIARRNTERDAMDRNGPGETFIVGGCNSDALGGTRVPTSCKCIADKCAMWRWVAGTNVRKRRFVNYMGETAPKRPNDVGPEWVFVPRNEENGEPAFWTEPEEMQHARRMGYCGLAGRPA